MALIAQDHISPWEGISRVTVVGLGVTGVSVVRHLERLNKDLRIRVIDTRCHPPGMTDIDGKIPVHYGSWNEDWLVNSDLIVVNPGIALSTPELLRAKALGIRIVGDIELFAWSVQVPVIAITGSNGKSTVTDLTGVLANAAGVKTYIGGNIGVPALDLLEQKDAALYILELSSFQLETTESLNLEAAAFLNFSEDHMDRYDTLADYQIAKQRIFKRANVAIVNGDDKATYPFKTDIKICTFGLSSQNFDFYLSGNLEKSNDKYLSAHGSSLLNTNALNLVGEHNYANALVALAFLDTIGVDISPNNQILYQALCQYQGLSHRCQLVSKHQGVSWINDSKATNVASTLAALSGLSMQQGYLYLLLGGQGKGADFTPLVELASSSKIKVHCFGADGLLIASLLPKSTYWETLDQAMAEIAKKVQPQDMVLLSPACASLDQYPNFMARGEAFIQLVHHYTSSV